jgi:hypothetical protein
VVDLVSIVACGERFDVGGTKDSEAVAELAPQVLQQLADRLRLGFRGQLGFEVKLRA